MKHKKVGSRAKSKTNPEGICDCCKEKIRNKSKSAKYCKRCYGKKRHLECNVHSTIRKFRNRNPEYKITSKLNIEIIKK